MGTATATATASLLLLSLFLLLRSAAAMQKKIHITDNLDDIVDSEEDEAWKEWGKPPPPPDHGPDPSDLHKMDLPEIQAHFMKHHVGPTVGFVKLRFGVPRTKTGVALITKKWSKLLRTGTVKVEFMGIDLTTIMFTTFKGRDTEELVDFILEQEDAYEVRIGDRTFRRSGDPPLEEVIESLRKEREKEEKAEEKEKDGKAKDEL